MQSLKREARVAFSLRVQPLWFRLLKWTILLGLIKRARTRPAIWRWLAGLTVAGLGLHLFYRAKTRGWTRPWGGWHDLAAVRQKDYID
jgi:hypothetical protein